MVETVFDIHRSFSSFETIVFIEGDSNMVVSWVRMPSSCLSDVRGVVGVEEGFESKVVGDESIGVSLVSALR